MNKNDFIYFNDEWNQHKPDPANYDDMKIYLRDLELYKKHQEQNENN